LVVDFVFLPAKSNFDVDVNFFLTQSSWLLLDFAEGVFVCADDWVFFKDAWSPAQMLCWLFIQNQTKGGKIREWKSSTV